MSDSDHATVHSESPESGVEESSRAYRIGRLIARLAQSDGTDSPCLAGCLSAFDRLLGAAKASDSEIAPLAEYDWFLTLENILTGAVEDAPTDAGARRQS